VATADATVPMDTIKWQINYFVRNFKIDGFFFDEVSNDWSDFAYYQNIIAYARLFSKVRTVILNSPYASPAFVDSTSADAVVIFENFGRYWKDFNVNKYKSLKTSKKAIIVHSVWRKTTMKLIIRDAIVGNIGYVFVTDKDYSRLPSYWADEVSFIQKVNTNDY
jgi:hypothetical protein